MLRLVGVVVVGKNRNVQDVSFGRGLRNRSGDFTSVLIDLDGPRTAVIRDGVFGLTTLKRVALRSLVARVTTQAALRELRLQAHLRRRLVGHRVVIGDLDVHDRLELSLDLVRGLVRVGRLHRRGDDRARCDSVVRLRGNPAGLVDSDGPSIGNGGRVNLEFSRVNRLVALHDGLGAHLGGEVVTDFALSQARTYQVSDLGVVRVDNHEQLENIGGTVRVLDGDCRSGERARLRFLRGGDGDVVILVHLDGPALVDVFLVEGNLSFKAAVVLLLRQFLNQVWDLGEGDLLRLGSNRTGSTIDAGDDRSVRLVVLRVVVLGVVQGERLGVDHVRRVIARQRIRTVEGLAFFADVVFNGILELVDGTWLRQNGEVHVLVGRQVGTTVFRPGEVDVAGFFVDAQQLLTAGDGRIRGADELAVAVVGFHDHAGHRVVRTAVLHSRNVDRTDLGFLTRDDHMLLRYLSSLPRNRDRVTFDVLARPRVYSSAKSSVGPLGRVRTIRIVLLVVALPGVTYRVISRGRSELLDFLIGQLCVGIQVP